jgi:hypothetical protein
MRERELHVVIAEDEPRVVMRQKNAPPRRAAASYFRNGSRERRHAMFKPSDGLPVDFFDFHAGEWAMPPGDKTGTGYLGGFAAAETTPRPTSRAQRS